ncbi:MAG: putative Ig domain-containing protein [bacterium]|nr:putative Ig domain-containing protein [bacterium]
MKNLLVVLRAHRLRTLLISGVVIVFGITVFIPQAKSDVSWQSLSGTDLQVRLDHPRILINPETLPSIKCRIGEGNTGACNNPGSTSDLYQEFTDFVDNTIDDDRNGTDSQIDENKVHLYALKYALSGDSSYCDVPVRRMLYDAANTPATFYQGDGPARTYSTALAFDWCYNTISGENRITFANYIVEIMENYFLNSGYHVNDANPWLPHMETIANPLAVIFEPGLVDPNDTAEASLRDHYDVFRNAFIEGLDQFTCDGAFDGYGGIRYDYMRIGAEAFLTGTSYTSAFAESDFLRNAGGFWMQKLRSDLNFMKNPGKWNTSHTNLPGYFSLFAMRYDDPYYQWMADYYVENDLYNDGAGLLDLLLWYDPSIPVSPDGLDSYPTVRPGTCSGMSYMRSDWDFSEDAQTIQAAFFNGPDMVSSKSQNSFMINRGDDSLAIKSGQRVDDLSLSYQNYYTNSISVNGISIVDPDQDFGEDPYHAGYSKANSGGQVGSDKAAGRLRWPAADGTYGYRGEITRSESSPGEYTYYLGDATQAYGNPANPSDRTDNVTRSFVYLPDDTFVVFDRVQATDPDFAKVYNLHMIDRPLVNGSLTTIEGNWNRGGVFEFANSDLVTIRYGDSALLSRTLLPANRTTRVVGGENCHGENMKESWIPSDDPYYIDTLTHSDCTSYEQWIDGRNYTPNSRNLTDDDEPRSELYSEKSLLGRNSENPGNESGDWRVEIETSGQESDTFLHVMQAAAGDLFVDNTSTDFSKVGVWDTCDYYTGYALYNNNCFDKSLNNLSSATATWNFTVTRAGDYEAFVWIPKILQSGFATAAPYVITHEEGSSQVAVNLNGHDGDWVSLGTYPFQTGAASVQLRGAGSDGKLLADAAKLVYQDAPLEMKSTELLTSQNGNMSGTLINSDTAVLFSATTQDITSTTVNINANGAVRFLFTDLAPDTGYSVAIADQVVMLSPGSQYTSSSEGVLYFSALLSGEINYSPVIQDIPDQEINEGQPVSITVQVDDADPQDIITITTDSLPAGATFEDHGDRTGTFTWTPSNSQSGQHQVTFIATDPEGLFDRETVILTVINVNQPPNLLAISPKTINEQDTLEFIVIATDPDATDTLVFSASNLPQGAVFIDNHNRTGTFTWTPSSSQSGEYADITILVQDNENAIDTETFTITVLDGVADCQLNWQCSEWSSCQEGTQERNCTDTNNCGTDSGRPEEIRTCDSVPPSAVENLRVL